MGLFSDLRDLGRALIGATPESPRTDAPDGARPRMKSVTAKSLARTLIAEYPEGVPAEALVERSADADLDAADVDRAIDALLYAAEERARVKVSKVDPAALRIIDLGDLDAVRTRIKGSMYSVTDAQRATHSGTEYLLIREPKNRVDTKAVAVYGKGRRVGYVSAAKAATLAPLLDSLEGDAFRVTGAGVIEGGSSRLWVDLPKVAALRAFVKASTA